MELLTTVGEQIGCLLLLARLGMLGVAPVVLPLAWSAMDAAWQRPSNRCASNACSWNVARPGNASARYLPVMRGMGAKPPIGSSLPMSSITASAWPSC